jgi:hypothetical protein
MDSPLQAANHRSNLGSLCDLKQPSCRSRIDESFGTLYARICTREVCALLYNTPAVCIISSALHAYHLCLVEKEQSSSILDWLVRLNVTNTSTYSTQLISDANCAQPVVLGQGINLSMRFLLCRAKMIHTTAMASKMMQPVIFQALDTMFGAVTSAVGLSFPC